MSLLRFVEGAPLMQLVSRFPNSAKEHDGRLQWEIDSVWEQLQEGLRTCGEIAQEGIASIGVDGWAVDYVRLDADGRPLAAPYCYRDTRTVAAEERVRARVSDEEMFSLTGVQPLRINTLFQLVADNAAGVPADAPWVNLPEYILYLLSGVRVAEYTNATHTQLVESGTKSWCSSLFRALDLSLEAAPPIVASGTILGPIQGALAKAPGYARAKIIAPACHDTASAIAGIPADGADWAYISSGTWSLVGTLLPVPCKLPDALAAKFTNLGAAGGDFCFHRNVNGMWLLRQCMDTWAAAGKEWKIDELVAAARQVPPSPARFDVDEATLLLPGDVLSRINLQFVAGGFAELPTDPDGAPQVASVLLQNLAARYAQVMEEIPVLTGREISRIYVVGGGSRNALLNDFTEIACGIPVSTGFAESSTIGNFAIQLAALRSEMGPGTGVNPPDVKANVQLLEGVKQT